MEKKRKFWNAEGGYINLSMKTVRRIWNLPQIRLIRVVLIVFAIVYMTAGFWYVTVERTVYDKDRIEQLQSEAGLPESAGISQKELAAINGDIWWGFHGFQIEPSMREFEEEFGYAAFDAPEMQRVKALVALVSGMTDRADIFNFSLFLCIWIVELSARGVFSPQGRFRLMYCAILGSVLLLLLAAGAACLWADRAPRAAGIWLCRRMFAAHPELSALESGMLRCVYPQSVLVGLAGDAVRRYAINLMIVFGMFVVFLLIEGRMQAKNEDEEEGIDDAIQI